MVIRIFMLIKELRVPVNDFILEWGLDLFFGLLNVVQQSLFINEQTNFGSFSEPGL